MKRRVDTHGPAVHTAAPDQSPRLQAQRRTQLRLQARRRVAARLHDELLVQQAQHAIGHSTHMDRLRDRRRELLSRLNPPRAAAPGRNLAAGSGVAPRHAAAQDGGVHEYADAVKQAGHDQYQGGGHGGQQSAGDQHQGERQGHQHGNGNEDPRGYRQGERQGGRIARPSQMAIRHAISSGPVTALRRDADDTEEPSDGPLTMAAEKCHTDVLTRDAAMAQAWVDALLSARAAVPEGGSFVDGALAAFDDLLAAWQRYGEHFNLPTGRLLPLFLPALRGGKAAVWHEDVSPSMAEQSANCLLPLLLISGYRYREDYALTMARTRIQNLRRARRAP